MNTITEAKKIINKHTGVSGIPNAHETLMAMQEYAQLYHSRKCEEAGKELPTRERMEEIATEYSTWINKKGKEYDGNRTTSYLDNITGLAEMKQLASTLFASLKSQLEVKGKENEELKFHVKKLEDLVFAKDGVILELRPQLQKANAELERLKPKEERLNGFWAWLEEIGWDYDHKNYPSKWSDTNGNTKTEDELYEEYKSQL